MFLRTDGTVYFWGSCGSVYTYGTAILAPGIDGIVAVAAGGRHSLALRADGTVWGWGDNSHGQLGGGTVWNYDPRRVEGLDEVAAIAAGDRNGLAVRADGSVWAWGASAGNYLGTGAYSAIIPPTMVIGISGAAVVASGEQVIAAVDGFGDLWRWGMSYPGASPAILYPIGEPRRITVF